MIWCKVKQTVLLLNRNWIKYDETKCFVNVREVQCDKKKHICLFASRFFTTSLNGLLAYLWLIGLLYFEGTNTNARCWYIQAEWEGVFMFRRLLSIATDIIYVVYARIGEQALTAHDGWIDQMDLMNDDGLDGHSTGVYSIAVSNMIQQCHLPDDEW